MASSTWWGSSGRTNDRLRRCWVFGRKRRASMSCSATAQARERGLGDRCTASGRSPPPRGS
eukprot:1305392-Alexandrium_andersonii.AAC.1